MYDVIIIGAGPAGMTAAVYVARKKLKTLLLTKDVGGQTNWTNDIQNYMGYQFVEGPELMKKFENQVKQFPIDLKTDTEIANISKIDAGFEVTTESGDVYQGTTAIIASGKRPRSLNVPGEERLRGRGVSYCSICDGPLFSGMSIAVIGGGNSALEAANDMLQIADHVYVVSLTPLTGDPVLIDNVKDHEKVTIYTEHSTTEIKGEATVSAIRVRDLKTNQEIELDVQGIFVEIGLIPNSQFAQGMVTLNEAGEIEVGRSCETTIPGLYAAGDVTNVPEKQIVVAAGEGAKAALQAHRYLQRLGNRG